MEGSCAVSQNKLYIKALKKWFFIIYGIFVAVGALTIAVGALLPGVSDKVTELFTQFASESGIVSSSGTLSAVGLFFNNSRAALISILYGFVPFLFLPAAVIAVNALLVGFVLASVSGASGIGVFTIVAVGILPHGIFEITALVLASSAGMVLCTDLCRMIIKRPRAIRFGDLVAKVAVTYAAAVLPLMLIAAVVESYITPLLMELAA